MCVATPMKVTSIEGNMARVNASGLETSVSIELVDGLCIGDYVIVHAGYAIQRLEAEEAQETLAILERLRELSA